MTSIMSHFPILAIMALFLGAFLVALLGRKSAGRPQRDLFRRNRRCHGSHAGTD